MKTAALLLGVALLAGCASAAKSPIVTTFRVPGEYDRIWSATIDVLGDLNLPVQSFEKRSGKIKTDWTRLTVDQADQAVCMGTDVALKEGREAMVQVFVQKVEGGAAVQVTSSFRQLRDYGRNSGWVECESTGKLEDRIRALITEKTGP